MFLLALILFFGRPIFTGLQLLLIAALAVAFYQWGDAILTITDVYLWCVVFLFSLAVFIGVGAVILWAILIVLRAAIWVYELWARTADRTISRIEDERP